MPARRTLLLAELDGFLAQILPVGGVAEGNQHAIQVQRLLDEIVGAGLERLHGEVHRAVPGHDDHRGLHAFQGQGLHHFNAILARHFHVAENHVVLAVEGGLQARIPVLRLVHRVLLVFEDVLQGVPDEALVVDDEDVGHAAKMREIERIPLRPDQLLSPRSQPSVRGHHSA